MIVYHHSDIDGRCAAAIVLSKYPECRTREINYNETPDFEQEVGHCEKVYIVDFSFGPKLMDQLLLLTKDIVWIDHHKTAKHYNYDFPGKRDFSEPGLSGCELTWQYAYPSEEIPEAIRLIGDYDTWRLDTEEDSKAFHVGLQLHCTNPNSFHWHVMFQNDTTAGMFIRQTIKEGRLIRLYKTRSAENFCKSWGWTGTLNGYDAYIINRGPCGSDAFGEKIDQYPLCISVIFNGTNWTVSLYSKTVDAGAIATLWGGGGHSGAAGFVCFTLPIVLLKP